MKEKKKKLNFSEQFSVVISNFNRINFNEGKFSINTCGQLSLIKLQKQSPSRN